MVFKYFFLSVHFLSRFLEVSPATIAASSAAGRLLGHHPDHPQPFPMPLGQLFFPPPPPIFGGAAVLLQSNLLPIDMHGISRHQFLIGISAEPKSLQSLITFASPVQSPAAAASTKCFSALSYWVIKRQRERHSRNRHFSPGKNLFQCDRSFPNTGRIKQKLMIEIIMHNETYKSTKFKIRAKKNFMLVNVYFYITLTLSDVYDVWCYD